MEIAQIILESVLILIGLYLSFFKSYFQEKGKNLATKEDITEITELVETVKNQMHFHTESKLSLKTEERNTLVKYYEKYNYWLNTILDSNVVGVSEDNRHKFKEITQRLNEAKFKFDIAQGRKNVFVENKEIEELLKELKLKTLELQHLVELKIGELELLFIEIEQMKKSTPIEEQLNEYTRLYNKRSEIYEALNTEKLDRYKEIVSKDYMFQKLVYNHLQRLITNK